MSLVVYTKNMSMIKIDYYSTSTGKEPCKVWMKKLDFITKSVVMKRLARVRLGNFGDTDPVGDGVYELRIDYGPGIRVYYAKVNKILVILLMGGSKSTQARDIEKAKKYWIDYRELADDK